MRLEELKKSLVDLCIIDFYLRLLLWLTIDLYNSADCVLVIICCSIHAKDKKCSKRRRYRFDNIFYIQV